jgi:ketose-bisphosphate aldolase
MTLEALPDLLERARAGGYAVGYFEAWDLDSLEVIASVAERLRAPAIVGFGGLSADEGWLDAGGIRRSALLCRDVAESLSVPAVALLNEVSRVDQAEAGLDAGYNAAMLHTQGHSFDASSEIVAKLVAVAHARGAGAEGEIGEMPEEHGGVREASREHRTTPEEAVTFVERTGVDCLAVAVGNAHFVVATERSAIDVARIAEIASAVRVPLVLHGGSGLPEAQVRDAIAAGVAKVNVGTRLRQRFALELKRLVVEVGATSDFNELVGSRKGGDLVRRALQPVAEEVERLTRVLMSDGKA